MDYAVEIQWHDGPVVSAVVSKDRANRASFRLHRSAQDRDALRIWNAGLEPLTRHRHPVYIVESATEEEAMRVALAFQAEATT
jgi:hypothetical protein